MKKIYIKFLVLFFVLGISATTFGAPLVGTWNASKLGTPELQGLTDPGIFKIRFAFTDPERDGGTIGDVLYFQDLSSPFTPFVPNYWGARDLIRDTMTNGPIVDQGGGIGISTYYSSRSGGTFKIWGDHLWGQAAGTTYTASLQGETIGAKTYYDWVGGKWIFNRQTGDVHYWGAFNNDPYLLDFTCNFSIVKPGLYRIDYPPYGWIAVYDGDNVAFQIRGVPEPTTMLLLGLGLIGLAGIRRKFQK